MGIIMLILALLSEQEVSSWTLPDWLTVIGFPATGIALLLAYLHIGGIKRAAKEAEKAARNALQASEAAKAGSEASKDAATAAEGGADAARRASEEARDAAAAAREAIARTEQKLADQNLLMLIGQVQGVIAELDRARTDDELTRVASEWIGVGGELDGILKAGGTHPELAQLLDPSISAAGNLKNAIYERKEDAQMAAMPLRTQLTEVRASASRIMGHMRAYTREEPRA